MSLAPEAAAFLGRPPAQLARGRSVRLLTGNEPDEDTMPKTSTTEAPRQKRKYTRRKAVVTPLETTGDIAGIEELKPLKRGRKPREAKPAGVVFSIDSTGALLIRRGDYGMEFSAAEVDAMMAFLEKSRILWGPE